MNLHEYQSKQLFAQYAIPVPKGEVAGSPEEAVVGPDLRLHGLEGLRVCDASVMPRITSGNTNAPTYMIAERGADLILGRVQTGSERELTPSAA